MKSNSRVYVIGHKNPDTDSICSAIAYADIKNRTDKTNLRGTPCRSDQRGDRVCAETLWGACAGLPAECGNAGEGN